MTDRLVCAWTRGSVARPSVEAGVTFVEAVAEGWWYTAPLPGERRVLAFHTDSDLLVRGPIPPGVAAILDGCGFVQTQPVAVKPANSGRLEILTGNGWLAAGDAAVRFDPLSAQGIFNALYTGLAAGEAADRHLAGDRDALPEYGRAVEGIYAAYGLALSHWYRAETRFPGSAFWQRRGVGRLGSIPGPRDIPIDA